MVFIIRHGRTVLCPPAIGSIIGRERRPLTPVVSMPKDVGYMRNIWKYVIFLVAIFLMIVTVSVAMSHDSGNPAEPESRITNAPEFPSVFFPAMVIIGFLGVVLHIQRTREY